MRRERLRDLRRRFAHRLAEANLDLCGSVTQIVPVLTRDPQPTMRASQRLLDEGVFLQGIRPPTVAEGRCRLRATVMADHDPEDLEAAARSIVRVLGGEGA